MSCNTSKCLAIYWRWCKVHVVALRKLN